MYAEKNSAEFDTVMSRNNANLTIYVPVSIADTAQFKYKDKVRVNIQKLEEIK